MITLHYLLDTYAWIEYFIGSKKGAVVKRIIEGTRNTLTTLESSMAELQLWCLKERRDFSKLFEIIRSCSSIEPITLETWVSAAKIKHEKRKHLKDFGLMDALLLAKQSQLKCRIVTGDRHFKNLKDVEFLK